jgi:hypothetical protein
MREYAPNAQWQEAVADDGVTFLAKRGSQTASFFVPRDMIEATNARDPKLAWPDVRKVAKQLQRDLGLRVLKDIARGR